MGFSIDGFRAAFSDLSRQYQFKIKSIATPGNIFDINDNLDIIVDSTTLPTRVITPVDVPFMGHQLKLGGNVEYADWSVTFRVPKGYNIYTKMRTWQELIRKDNDVSLNMQASYKGLIEMTPLNFETTEAVDSAIGTLSLNGAYPSTLGEITYDVKSSDIQTFMVTFTYDYHKWVV